MRVPFLAILLGGLLAASVSAQCLQQTVNPSGGPKQSFGFSIAVQGDVMLVGAPFAEGVIPNTGAAYVFRWNGTFWYEVDKLFASDGADDDRFGSAVALSADGTWAVVGAYWSSGSSTLYSGSAYVFHDDGTGWQEFQKFTASTPQDVDQFGTTVAIDGSWIAIGTPGHDGVCPGPFCDSGSVDLFEYDGTLWQRRQQVTPQNVLREDYFGQSVSLEGNRLVVGAPGDDQVANWAGAAYVYDFDGTTWNEGQKLLPSAGDLEDQFGYAVDQEAGVLVIGAPEAGPFTIDPGSAYVFRHDGTAFQEEHVFHAEKPHWNLFGETVSISQGQVLIGAHQDNDLTTSAGAAYLYRHDGLDWQQRLKMFSPASSKYQYFGRAVCLSGRRAMIGAQLTDSVYVYRAPLLTLNVTPANPSQGDTIVLALDEGQAFGPLLVVIVDVDGVPAWIRVDVSTFDGAGQWSHTDVVPPGLAGVQMTFLGVARDACAAVNPSSFGVVAFQ